MSAAVNPLRGLRVLIVEDETLVAMLIEEYLLELGCEVAFSASRVAKAMRGLQTCGIDVAVLDVNVAGESISQVVETLVQRGIPFLFASGYGARGSIHVGHAALCFKNPSLELICAPHF